MKIKTFILTFLMMMSCSILFGQELLTGEAKTESKLKQFLYNEDYGTITIVDDFSVSSTIEIPNGRKITIDLNGHKLTTNADIYIFKNFGRLTITDNSTDGKGTISSLGIYNGKPQTRTNTDDIDYTAQLTIKGGVFENISPDGGAAIYNHLGVIDIQGGEFYGEYSAITNFGVATIANAYIECLNRDNDAAAIINDFEIEYGNNVNVVGRYTAYSGTASITDGEATYLFAELNGTKYLSLQAALNACTTGDNTINLLFHNSDNATVSQEEGVNITIDGNGYKGKQFEYTGTIYVNGNSRHTGTETLTIQDVNFVTTDNEHDFISCNDGGNSVIRYAHNVTVQNCNFTATEGSTAVVALRFRQSYNINVVNSEFTNLHSAMWATGTSGIAFDNITATNCKEGGISVATSTPVSVNNFIMEGEGAKYGVRADGSGAYSLTVENSTLEAEVPVIVRNTTGEYGEYNLTVAEDVTLTATSGGPQVVVTADSDNKPYVAPTVKVNVTLNNDASTFGLVAKIGNKYYSTLDEAFAVATEDQTIVLLADATPVLTSQRAITKAAVIDLGGKTLTLTEDDLYFGTTEFKNGNIIVDPSVNASTAVFWMFENQTLTFDNVNITATGVTGTYLIGINGGTGSAVNLLNNSSIIIDNESQAELTAVICDNGTNNNVKIENSTIDVKNIEGRFYLGGTQGDIVVDNTDITLNGVKEGFYLRANQTLSIEGESEVEVVLNDTNNRYGINITDYSATYTKDDLATVNATVYDPVVRVKNLTELQTALVENVDKPIFATEIIVISEGTLELDLNTRRVFAADKNVIRNDGATLTIKNGTIERVGDVVGYAFNNAQGALNITGTTIKGGLYTSGTSLVATNANISHFQSSRHAIYAYDCNVTLNGGTYHNDNSGNATIMAAGSSVVTIKDGTFSIKDGRQELTWTSCLIDTQNTASITVEGGTFNGGFRVQSGTMTIEGGSFNDCYGSGYNIYDKAVVKVKGGTFTDANAINFAKRYLAEGYVASDNGNDTFTVLKGVAKIGDTYYATLQAAIDAVQNGETITLLSDITENVTLTEKVGLYYTINGSDKTMNGSITVNPLSDTNDNRRITISNINFVENTDTDVNFISAVKTNHYPRLTISGCDFTGSGNVGAVVAVRLKSSHSVVIENCTGTGLHSFLQNTAGWNLTIDNVDVNGAAEGGFALGTVQGVTVKNCEINSGRYGIRLDGQYNNNAVIESNKINAFIPVVVRKASVDGTITFNGTNEFTQSNTDGYWCVIGTTEYEENGEMPTAPTASVSVTLNDTGLERKGIYGSALNGEGTEEKPYLIETVNDLVFFRDQVNGGNNYAGKHVQLAADIDLSSIENWTPIGDITYNSKYEPADASKVFSGVFDGNNKVIYNLTINKTVGGADAQSNVGLFGITGEGAVIKNLTLTNVDITTDGRNVGALAGFAYKATLDNITVNGNIQIKGGNNVSGVAGMTRYYDMSATNIKVVGNDGSAIVGNNIVGGIFAEIAPNKGEQTFKNLSVENVAINGVGGVGGIVGLLTLGTVEDVTVKNVALTGNTLYNEIPMGRIRLGSVAGLMGGEYATIANVTTENVTAKNLDGDAVVLPIIGANYGSASNATEARIGDTYYATLQIAINKANNGETIELLTNVNNNVTFTAVSAKELTLDLNGYTITSEDNSTITVSNGNHVIIEDSSEPSTGMIKSTADNCEAIAVKDNGNVTFVSGTAYHPVNGVYLYTAGDNNKFTMTGGTIKVDDNGMVLTVASGEATVKDGNLLIENMNQGGISALAYYGTINIEGGNISNIAKVETNYEGKVSITGGTFTFANNETFVKGTIAPFHYAVENENGTFTVIKNDVVLNGTGVENDPYLISNVNELMWFRDYVNLNGTEVHAALTNDIDMSDLRWVSIGTSDKKFTGTFDGRDNTLSNLNADDNECGLFRYTHNATVKNLTIENVTVIEPLQDHEGTGAVIGVGSGTTRVENVTVKGKIAVAGKRAGAIVGYVYSGLYAENCHVIGSGIDESYVNAFYWASGGIIGFSAPVDGHSEIKNCSVKDIKIWAEHHYGAGAIAGTFKGLLEDVTAENVNVIGKYDEESNGLLCGYQKATGNSYAINSTLTVGDAVIENPCDIVAKIGDNKMFCTLEAAATVSQNGETIQLIWAEGNDPIAMAATFVGNKTVTITGTADVDWSKGFFFVGRNGEGDGKVIFDNANLTSGSNSSAYGFNVSGSKVDDNTTNNGIVEIKNSTIVLDYMLNKNVITLDNSTLTVKNGFSVTGRIASESATGEDATATMTLSNNSKVVVNNMNGMGIGHEAYGIMNIDVTSTFETTQDFNISAKGTMNVNGGNVKVVGTLTNAGTVNVTGEANLDANVTGNGWFYMNGVTLDADTKLLGAKVRFASGTNNIDGSTINDGFFQVGIGAYNGVDANVDTENGVVVNVKNAVVGANGDTYAGWAGTGFYDTDDEKAAAMTDAKYVLNIENSIAEFGYLHISNDGELNVNGNATEKAWYNNSDYSFYAGDFIINGTANFNNTDVLALYTKVSCDNGTSTPGTLNINEGTEYEAERHNGAVAGLNFDIRKTGIVNVAEGADLHVGEPASIAADATMNIGGTATVLGELTNNGTINFTDDAATLATTTGGLTINYELNPDKKVVYVDGVYKVVEKVYVAQIGDVKFESLQEAIDAATNDATIVLIESIEQADGVIIDSKNIVVDLNEETFTVTEGANTNNRNFKIIGTSVVTIKNGTMVAAGDYSSGAYGTVRTEGKANVTLTGLKLYNYRGNGLNIKALGGTTVAIDNTEIYSQYGGGIEAAGGTITLAETVKVEQKGMYTAPYNSMAISVNGGGKVTVDGGTYSTECITAEEAGNQGTSHGPWVVGVLNSGGKLIINGGTFSNDNYGDNSLATYARGAVLADTGAEIEIKGGTFNALEAIIDMTNNLGDANNNPSALLSGGTFSADPRISGMYASHLIVVADGYSVVDNENGTYSVIMTSGTQEIALALGWNWFSSYIDLSGETGLEKVQTALGDNGVQIKGKFNNNSSSYQDLGNGTSAWIGDFDLSTKQMYMINTSAAVTMEIEGDVVDREETTISLGAGWNWISYPLYETVDINEALANHNTAADGDAIKTLDKTSVYYSTLDKWIGDLTELTPGQGYMYKSANATSFVYSAGSSRSAKSDAVSENKFWKSNANKFANNMTVVAMLSIDGEIVNDNYEIAAFANGECRGSARPVYVEELDQYILFLTINGEDVQELTFKYYDVNYGTVYELNNRINYSNDAVLGSIDEPYMFNLGILNIEEATLSDINIYPNPTTTGKEINLEATCDKVEVFNALGVKVAEYSNVDSIDALETAGIYVIRVTIDGDARNCRLVVK